MSSTKSKSKSAKLNTDKKLNIVQSLPSFIPITPETTKTDIIEQTPITPTIITQDTITPTPNKTFTPTPNKTFTPIPNKTFTPTIKSPNITIPTITIPNISTSTITIPNISTSTITTSTITTPSITTSTITTPNITTSTITTPSISTPSISSPTITTPSISTSTITTPSISTSTSISSPTITTPISSTPSISTPNITTSTITTPSITTPNITTSTSISSPTITTPTISSPSISSPTITTSTISTPSITTSTISTPSITTSTSLSPTIDIINNILKENNIIDNSYINFKSLENIFKSNKDTNNDIINMEKMLNNINNLVNPNVVNPNVINSNVVNSNLNSNESINESINENENVQQIIKENKCYIDIYDNNTHIIKYYKDGIDNIYIPKYVDITTVLIMNENAELIPYTYNKNVLFGTEEWVEKYGNEISVIIKKKNETYSGKIVSIDKNNILLNTEKSLVNIKDYDAIIVDKKFNNNNFSNNNFSNNNFSNNNFNDDIFVINKNIKNIYVSYIVNNITWKSKCIGLLNNNDKTINFKIIGSISNTNDRFFKGKTQLISSKNHKSKTKNLFALSEEYIKYEIGEKTIENTVIEKLVDFTSKAIKIYEHDTKEIDKVKFGYKFPVEYHIPECQIDMYMKENKLKYMGTYNIKETKNGSNINLIMGLSDMVKCVSTSTTDEIVGTAEILASYNIQSTDNNVKISNTDIAVSISNDNTEKSQLIIKHYIGDSKLISLSCQNPNKTENGYLYWYFELLPKKTHVKKDVFTFKIITYKNI